MNIQQALETASSLLKDMNLTDSKRYREAAEVMDWLRAPDRPKYIVLASGQLGHIVTLGNKLGMVEADKEQANRIAQHLYENHPDFQVLVVSLEPYPNEAV